MYPMPPVQWKCQTPLQVHYIFLAIIFQQGIYWSCVCHWCLMCNLLLITVVLNCQDSRPHNFPRYFLPLSLHPCSHNSPWTFLLAPVPGPLFSQLCMDACSLHCSWTFVLANLPGPLFLQLFLHACPQFSLDLCSHNCFPILIYLPRLFVLTVYYFQKTN